MFCERKAGGPPALPELGAGMTAESLGGGSFGETVAEVGGGEAEGEAG